jgi:hypothetical protein
MKRLFFICLIGLISTTSFAQSLPDFDAIQLNVKEDYDSVADNAALQAANYCLIHQWRKTISTG